MSMIGNLARISELTRQKLHQNPDIIGSFLYPDLATCKCVGLTSIC